MTQLMRNAAQSRIKIREHSGREIDSPGRRIRKSEYGPVGMESAAHLQEFLMLENDNRHRFIGVRGGAKFIG